MASRELKVEIVGDSRSLERALGRSSNAATGFSRKFAKAGKVIGVAALGMGAAVGAGLFVTLKRGFEELSESQKVMAQTQAALKSTGAVANVTAKDIETLATSQSLLTGIDDELIQQNENLLLTFKNVHNEVGKGNDVFDRATKASLDLSTAGFGSLTSSAKMMGKALNDPIKGMTALGRAGVTFSASQKETIAKLVETGHTLDAQKLILKEVESQVGGSAKAYGETLPGQLARARNAFDEIAGNLATKFLPMLTSILDWVNAHWPQIAAVIGGVGRGITATFQAIGVAVNWLKGQWEIHRETAIATWKQVQAGVMTFIAWFKTNVVPAIQNVVSAAKSIWHNFGGEIQAIGARLVASVKQTFLNMVAPIRIILALIKGDWTEAWNVLKQVVTGTFGTMAGNIKAAGGALVSAAIEIGKGIVQGMVAGLSRLAGAVAGALKAAADTAYQFALNIGSRITSGIWDGLKGQISGLKDKISGAIGDVIGGIDIPGFSPPEAAAAKAIGKPIADGVLRGFLEGSAQLPQKMSEKLRASIEAGANAVRASQSTLSTAFQQLSTDALAAFDAATDTGLDKIQTKLDGKLKKIGDRLSAALKKIDLGQAALTPAEKALEKLDRSEAVRGLQEGLRAAQQALAEAAASGDMEAVLAAQRQLRDAQLALQRDSLQQQADRERAAADRAAEAARTRAEKQAAAATLQAQKQAANQALQYQAQRDLQQRHLQLMLDNLEAKLLQGDVTWRQAHKRIMLAFKDEFGPDMSVAGKNLGVAFGRGLRESINGVGSAAADLARAIARYLKLGSPTEAGPMSDLDAWWKPLTQMLASQLNPMPIVQAATGVGEALKSGIQDPTNTIIGTFGGFARAKDQVIDNLGLLQSTSYATLDPLTTGLVDPLEAASRAASGGEKALRGLIGGMLAASGTTTSLYVNIFETVFRKEGGFVTEDGTGRARDSGKYYGYQHGGIARTPQFATIAENGPEVVLPLNKWRGMGGGTNVYVTVQGQVTSERDLVASIRNALVQEGRRSGGNLLGGYA